DIAVHVDVDRVAGTGVAGGHAQTDATGATAAVGGDVARRQVAGRPELGTGATEADQPTEVAHPSGWAGPADVSDPVDQGLDPADKGLNLVDHPSEGIAAGAAGAVDQVSERLGFVVGDHQAGGQGCYGGDDQADGVG